MTARVVITGMAGVSALGSTWSDQRQALWTEKAGHQPLIRTEEDAVAGQKAQLGAPIQDFNCGEPYPRKKIRSMGRAALIATRATELALQEAGLLETIAQDAGGIAYGSTTGSPPSILKYAEQITVRKTMAKVSAADYMKFMSHTVLSNIAQFFEIRGRLIPSSAGCASGTLALGLAYETLRAGRASVMIAGGCDEFHPYNTTVYDLLGWTNPTADLQSTVPFQNQRQGLVLGEGAGSLVMETRSHALARGATILAEVIGFGSGFDGAQPWGGTEPAQARVIQKALADANLQPAQIDAIAAFATGVPSEDQTESRTLHQLFGNLPPVFALKSFLGHTLGASGPLELVLALRMLREGWLAPIRGLTTPDPACAPLNYATARQEGTLHTLLLNSFSICGVQASLIVRLP